jgi:hypothetical protein
MPSAGPVAPPASHHRLSQPSRTPWAKHRLDHPLVSEVSIISSLDTSKSAAVNGPGLGARAGDIRLPLGCVMTRTGTYGLPCRSRRMASRPAVVVDQPSPAAATRMACLAIPLDMTPARWGSWRRSTVFNRNGQRARITRRRLVWSPPLANTPCVPYIKGSGEHRPSRVGRESPGLWRHSGSGPDERGGVPCTNRSS